LSYISFFLPSILDFDKLSYFLFSNLVASCSKFLNFKVRVVCAKYAYMHMLQLRNNKCLEFYLNEFLGVPASCYLWILAFAENLSDSEKLRG
jgi:hypothetical protein